MTAVPGIKLVSWSKHESESQRPTCSTAGEQVGLDAGLGTNRQAQNPSHHLQGCQISGPQQAQNTTYVWGGVRTRASSSQPCIVHCRLPRVVADFSYSWPPDAPLSLRDHIRDMWKLVAFACLRACATARPHPSRHRLTADGAAQPGIWLTRLSVFLCVRTRPRRPEPEDILGNIKTGCTCFPDTWPAED